ncbi:Golgi transport complex subunit 4 [Massospora cicadina]|nr:Golgi transport complex subunit 4 [Massospora cicadina]
MPIDQMRGLTDVAEIQNQLQLIDLEEAASNEKLEKLLERKGATQCKLEVLEQAIRGTLSEAEVEMNGICREIDETATVVHEAISQVALYASEQLKVADAIKLLKETQLLQSHLECLREAHASGDFEASLEYCYQYLSLDFGAVSHSPFGKFLLSDKDAPKARFETIRQELVASLTQQMKELALSLTETNTYGKLVEMVKQFSQVGEHELGVSFLSSYIVKMLNEASASILARQDKDFPSKLRAILEDASRVVMEIKDLLWTRFGEPWFKMVVCEIVKNAELTLDRFQRAYADQRRLYSQLEQIHASYQPSMPSYSQGGQLDVRELDQILSEIAAMAQKLRLFQKLVQPITDQVEVGMSLQTTLDAFPVIEKYYLACSVDKALELDEFQEGASYSSSVDDILYLIKKELSVPSPHATQLSFATRLVSDLNDTVARTLRPASFSKETQDQFLESINIFPKMAASFSERRVASLRRLIDKGVAPKIQAFFSQLSAESDYHNNVAVTPIAMKLSSRFDTFLLPFKATLSPENFSWFIEEISTVVGEALAQFILRQRFDQLGALAIGSDIDIVKGYFSSQTDGYIKEAFARPVAMARLLECQSLDEAKELAEDPSFPSQLFTPEEFNTIFCSRLDF